MGGMGGGGGMEMVFISLREEHIPEEGSERMAAGFQEMMLTGGLQVSVVAVDNNQMIALANNVLQVMEVRKFACNMEQVLKVEYDKKTFPGYHITEEERESLNIDENGNKIKDEVKSDL
ncbi:unnamed protein product [Moneuplotes crassus]|nr:unnamed protein product [Moneuplotes crassus]